MSGTRIERLDRGPEQWAETWAVVGIHSNMTQALLPTKQLAESCQPVVEKNWNAKNKGAKK